MRLSGGSFLNKQGISMDNVFRRYWTQSEQARLLSIVRGSSSILARRDAAVIVLLISSGFRIGEFSRLSVADAEDALESRWLFLPRELRKGKKVDHQVPVTRPIEDALRALLATRREMGHGAEREAPLVYSSKGRRMSVRGYQFRIAQWCAAAKLEGSPHFARHTRAMKIKRESTARDWRQVVKGALGHASIESSEAYTGLSKEDLQRELERIDGPGRVRKEDLRRRYDERRAS